MRIPINARWGMRADGRIGEDIGRGPTRWRVFYGVTANVGGGGGRTEGTPLSRRPRATQPRSVDCGARRLARHAGTTLASSATSASVTATAASVSGSEALTP